MTLEETRERLKDFCLMDNILMSACFQDKECVELVIRVILNRYDLIVETVKTEETVSSLGRSVRFDIFAVDSQNRAYDIEIQRSDKGAGLKRARFYSGMLASHSLDAGEDFNELRDNYVIFITQHDVLGDKLPLYTLDLCIRENGRFPDEDGQHILYVNGENRDVSTALGKLIHDLFCKNPEDMYYNQLKQRTKYIKEDEEEVLKMEGAMEKIFAEGVQQGVQQGIQQGRKETLSETILRLLNFGKLTLEEVAGLLGLPLTEVQSYAKQG